MKIRFSSDYRGPLTGEVFFPAGIVADFPNGEALQLIQKGVANEVVEAKPVRPPTQTAPPKKG